MHGPNGTLITEKDTTTVGGADNYKKVHDSKTILSPSELSLNGGKNTFLDNKNSSAGCEPLPTFKPDTLTGQSVQSSTEHERQQGELK